MPRNTPPFPDDENEASSDDHEAKLKALEAALIEGEESGLATEFDFDEYLAFKARMRADYEK